jgi:hypothetical protein
VWTDRGNDAVYEPGQQLQVKVRASDDSYLLVYEIDAEGAIHVLYPFRGHNEMIEARRTIRVPSENDEVELVVQEPVGEAYLVAIASETPFRELPWYLRPYDPRADVNGYVGQPEDEDGITQEGRIVGDPFVAMERIRRLVVDNPDDRSSFATDYTTYYVHQQVRYPRYLCYDCHRPGRWQWWDGFDPYYASCSVFDFRVNWSWAWGPSYWFGHVPYYVYVYRPDCPPRYGRWSQSGVWYSSWDGWNRWCDLWGQGSLRRYKSPPPASYIAPQRIRTAERLGPARPAFNPPGYVTNETPRHVSGRSAPPRGRSGSEIRPRETRGNSDESSRERWSRPTVDRMPASRSPRTEEDRPSRSDGRGERRERGDARPTPSYTPPRSPRGDDTPAPRVERREPDRQPPKQREPEARPAPAEKSPPPAAPPPKHDNGGGKGGGKGGSKKGDK